jgi:hypothetical protein
MTDESPRDVDWPTRRWLLWGLVAILIVAAVVMFFIWFADDTTEPIPENTGPQAEWSVALVDMSQQTVMLKADLPDGLETETWVDDLMLERGTIVGDRWAWDMDAELPGPVVEIDASADCAELNVHLDEWVAGIGAADGEVFNWQARAFTQHALNAMRAASCEIDEDAIAAVAG